MENFDHHSSTPPRVNEESSETKLFVGSGSCRGKLETFGTGNYYFGMVKKKFLVAKRTRFENFDARSSKKELLELLASKQKEPIFAIQHTKSSKKELFQPKGTWNLLTEISTKSSMIPPPFYQHLPILQVFTGL